MKNYFPFQAKKDIFEVEDFFRQKIETETRFFDKFLVSNKIPQCVVNAMKPLCCHLRLQTNLIKEQIDEFICH